MVGEIAPRVWIPTEALALAVTASSIAMVQHLGVTPTAMVAWNGPRPAAEAATTMAAGHIEDKQIFAPQRVTTQVGPSRSRTPSLTLASKVLLDLTRPLTATAKLPKHIMRRVSSLILAHRHIHRAENVLTKRSMLSCLQCSRTEGPTTSIHFCHHTSITHRHSLCLCHDCRYLMPS